MSSLLCLFIEYARPRALDRVSFLVGGAVRDLLLGISLKDIDIVLDGNPCAVADEFARAINGSFVVLDKEYGIFRVVRDDECMDFSPLRGGSIEQDLAERDLTINAMALPLSGDCRMEKGLDLTPAHELTIIDPYGGRLDLGREVIRMVSEDNFVKDPLRLLRTYRFAATLGFTIDMHTATAVRMHAALISSVAVERIMEEMRHIFRTDSSSGTLESMESDGLLDHIIPEMKALSGEQRFHDRQSYKYVEHILRNVTLYFPNEGGRLSAWLDHPFRRVVIKFASLLGEAALCRAASARLRMSGKESDLLEKVVLNADALQRDLDVAAMALLLRDLGDDVYAILVYGISRDLICQMAEHPVLSRARRMLAFYHEEFLPRRSMLPVVTGGDLMREFGVSPSPLLGRVLESIERGVLEGAITTRDEAMAAAGRILREDSALSPAS